MLSSSVYSRSFIRSSGLGEAIAGRCRWAGAVVALLVFTGEACASPRSDGDFGREIELAPFVVKGSPLSVSIHARTKGDRRYAEKFADEVVEVAYQTLGDFSGKGLVIVGAKGEPHPILVFRAFLEMARTGQLDPSLTEPAAELEAMLKKLEARMSGGPDKEGTVDISFDTFVPALPLPLEGVASRLYQMAWMERFDVARFETRLKALVGADLGRDELTDYDWVFYLPPKSASSPVFKELVNKGLAAEEVGLFKRAALRSALFVFGPAIRKAIEGMRKGILFMTILRAESPYDEGDIDALTGAYIRAMMPDLKPGSGDDRRRVLAAIEKQKRDNAEYAKDPFVKVARLATFDPGAYASFEGAYTLEPPHATHWFTRDGDVFLWRYKDDAARPFYPAGDGLFVNGDASMTLRFLVDETGTVTGVEERWVRRRQTVARKG